MNELEEKVLNRLEFLIIENQLSNDTLVQIIELCGSYLNLQTISDYSKFNNISYNGVKKCREVRKIFNVKFVVDNS
jgi:hypothetical protein